MRVQAEALVTRDLEREHGFEVLHVDGELPPELSGTLYRNGAGQFGQFGTRYTHPFEADGALTAIRFAGGEVTAACRVTRSAGLERERAAGRILYGPRAAWPHRFANAADGRRKNVSNINVIVWQGRVLTLWEGGRPIEIAPADLSTLGETDLCVIGDMFASHPHYVAARRATYSFGMQYGGTTKVHLYELPDAGAARRLGSVELAGPRMLHDFIATDSHLVFFVSPVKAHVFDLVLQSAPFAEMFEWQPELGTEVICVPIDRPDEVVRFTVDAFYQWHFTNAFVRDGRLVVDYIRLPNLDSLTQVGSAAPLRAADDGRYHRATIDLAARTLSDERLLDLACEFPTVAPAVTGGEHAAAYLMLGALAGIGRFDPRTGALDEHRLSATQRATEPIFVPRPGATAEDDGHVLALCHDFDVARAFLAVYDARRIAAGPVARAWFDHHVPMTQHGTFASTFAG
jgi:all-trans-8'-apo-beta-carotenal 15,15'-oxygenase